RLGEIVRRKLDRDFVARDDADEMLAHFAGNMREHVALTREIDPEHRSRQNLGHCAFHHDLFFLRHGAGIYSRRSPAQGGSAYALASAAIMSPIFVLPQGRRSSPRRCQTYAASPP